MKKIFWVFICLGFSFKSDYYSKIEFEPSFSLVAPVRSELSLTGSFGELRNNHFHAGIDLRSGYGPNGDDILAAADGYISKIVIDSDDYGKSMYIRHRNGMMTMYAHLHEFRKDINDYIKALQYQQKSFQLEIKLNPHDFPVKAGEMLAFMGNTGASRGKHLHFELRDETGEEVFDPFSYGLNLKDQIKPTIKRIKVYGYDEEGSEVSGRVFSKSFAEKNKAPIDIPGAIFSVGLEAFDRSDNSHNLTGIKTIKLSIDGGLFYCYSADSWKRDETKYINAHIDYFAKAASKGQFHRCFVLTGNKMNMYHSLQNDGFFYMSDNAEHEVQLIVGDANGNESMLNFKIRKKPFITTHRSSKYVDVIYHDLEKQFKTENASIWFPAGSVYEDLNCELKIQARNSALAYSDWISVIPSNIPVHLKALVKLKPNREIPAHLYNKCFIAIKRGNSVQSVGGKWENGELVAQARSLGPFCIMVDTLAPGIRPLVNKKKRFPYGQIAFRINDNNSTSKDVPDIHYDTYIDGKWVLAEYDKKSATIRHKFEPDLEAGTHNYQVFVRDYLGNEKTFKGSFVK